ncbi:MAG: DUF4917 family protein [Acidobacteriota bacterium]
MKTPQPDSVRWVDSFEEIAPEPEERSSLLLGNGFSIACDPRYSYQALRPHAEDSLPEVSRRLLDRIGSDNLEEAMQIVEDVRWVAERLEAEDLRSDLEQTHFSTQMSLVKALAQDHLRSPREIDVDQKRSPHAVRFLARFATLFTTNYDLLLYWTLMKNVGSEETGFRYRDGFHRAPEAPYGEFTPAVDPNVYYLHGALHLYSHGAAARKHIARAEDRGLVAIARETLEAGDSPLFVAAGRPEQKLAAIQASPYLTASLEAFRAAPGKLVIYGWSLGASDQHLIDAIAHNDALECVALSYYGAREEPKNLRLLATAAELAADAQKARGRPLDVVLYPSESARVWG